MALSVFAVRKNWTKNDAKRDRGLETNPSDIVRFDNVKYGDDPMQVMDIYRPKKEKGLCPVIVSVHGGAFVYGTKETYQFYCMDLARRGFAVVNFSYRLAPENPFPDSLKDVCRAFEFVKRTETIYGFDMKNVFAVGDSAGASLLCMYCNVLINSRAARILNTDITPRMVLPKAVGLNCGLYSSAACASGNIVLRNCFDTLFASYDEMEKYIRLFDVMNYMNEKFPPSYILMANRDFTTPSGKELLEFMTGKGMTVTSKIYGSFLHPLHHVFHVNMKKEEAKLANDEETSFFRKFITKPKLISGEEEDI